ncbi:YndJ family protein [Streptomyces sp. NPDC059851]|uniref:YndJ family protein n=1 Tax=Streptomyces sp. NPDC059851 TaxID=3346971 RepID=UPI00365DA852
MTVLVNVIVTLGMLGIVPAGLLLIDPAGLRRTARIWPLAAAPGALCLWLPRGAPAASLAVLYAVAALALAARVPVRLLRARALARKPTGRTGTRGTDAATAARTDGAAAEIAVLTALASPAVAATALVAERAGYRLFGFDLDVLALTVPHFHYAGFTAALVAGLVCRALASGRTAGGPRRARRARWAAYSVPGGTLLVLLGYFVDDWAELAGAVVLTAGMWLVALVTWQEIRPTGPDRRTRWLLAVSAGVLGVTMVLALWWALGEATGIPHPTLTWMAATHGLGNALGFALCSVLAWRRLTAGSPQPEETTP